MRIYSLIGALHLTHRMHRVYCDRLFIGKEERAMKHAYYVLLCCLLAGCGLVHVDVTPAGASDTRLANKQVHTYDIKVRHDSLGCSMKMIGLSRKPSQLSRYRYIREDVKKIGVASSSGEQLLRIRY